MDLDKYKTAWNNQPEQTNQVSKAAIYKMAHAKSSSIVKWIFIIGILEFLFWILLNLFTAKSKYLKIYDSFNLTSFIEISYYIHYIVIIGFLYIFYKNYTAISVTDGTKELLQKIFKVRKTVKFYVYYNLLTFIILAIIVNVFIFSDLNHLKKILETNNAIIDESSLFTSMLITQILFLSLFLGLFWLFYQLLYGILLKKLLKNYKELTKFDEKKIL
ncbi:hypothetical protein LNI90_05150 [Tenacibaculum dicentrarchi]|uniref:RDD domain-containing protein n=1 Tax=Tenacibaculum dicentrarchi TaxID=669041 RepID=A0ABM9NXT3_9FLAO|nr:hypothetical protein [Tenacibaculum dicentrarchi]MCD8414888.1 hypothetical protein [Tenacibaculum dicentrarchi]MCD8420012.1 hypothetical protein [Tenacibaculum dicentrarchi]MCD8425047.1 hypothetical protein [Tenacibaculum dicentrarchi]MCD8435098.1 hypothetical protein [Tenacibaculum dicentrarchi]